MMTISIIKKSFRSKLLLFIGFLCLLPLSNCKIPTDKPAKDDRYIEQLQNGMFSIIKITSVNGEKINFLRNDYRVSDTLYIDSIDINNNYSDIPQIMSLKEFKTHPLTYYKPKKLKK